MKKRISKIAIARQVGEYLIRNKNYISTVDFTFGVFETKLNIVFNLKRKINFIKNDNLS